MPPTSSTTEIPTQTIHHTTVISARATICPDIATDQPSLPCKTPRRPETELNQPSSKASVNKPTQSFLSSKLGRLPCPQFTVTAAQHYPELATLFASVTETFQPNSKGAKLPLTHGLQIAQWEKLRDGHNDPSLLSHLTYGFPLGFATIERVGIRVWPYLDDIVGLADDYQTALRHFKRVRVIMHALGLQEATHKAIEPTQALIWIGIHFDIVKMTKTIPLTKLQQP